jgi:hypothetical protein
MTRTKGAKDKKLRKKETKVRNTFSYVLSMYRRKKGLPKNWQLSAMEEKMLRIKWLWNQLDCIRRIPRIEQKGRKIVYLPPPRSRVVLKRPFPAGCGKYARYWYARKVSKLMIELFGKDVSEGLDRYYLPLSWSGKKIRFVSGILWNAVCRMMEKDNEKMAGKRPFKTEKQIVVGDHGNRAKNNQDGPSQVKRRLTILTLKRTQNLFKD